jgi:SAM-dependent methyltransferase
VHRALLAELGYRARVARRIRDVLKVPVLYRLLSYGLGGPDRRDAFSREHIRAREGDKVLDIGCGPADILPHLPRVDYVGFDLNPDYIETAKKNYSDRGRFYCRQISEETLDTHTDCDVVLASGVLHHLSDSEAEALFKLAYAALKPGGRLVTLDACWVTGQSRIAQFLISRDRGEHVRDEVGYTQIAKRVFSCVGATVRHDLLRIPYTHVLLECEKG